MQLEKWMQQILIEKFLDIQIVLQSMVVLAEVPARLCYLLWSQSDPFSEGNLTFINYVTFRTMERTRWLEWYPLVSERIDRRIENKVCGIGLTADKWNIYTKLPLMLS